MMKILLLILSLLVSNFVDGQRFDPGDLQVKIQTSDTLNDFFKKDSIWLGADGAASVDLENGKILWLFSDSFIGKDASRLRKNSSIIRNSIAIQEGYDLKTASLQYFWDKSSTEPRAYFHQKGDFWFWTGHGIRIKNKVLVFLMKVRAVESGLGFEVFDWSAVLISRLEAPPSKWSLKYLQTPLTYGTIAGSAAVLKDGKYLYAYGAVEPATHEVYVLRWPLSKAYSGQLMNPEWYLNGQWRLRQSKEPVPEPLFIGGTEFSVHYDQDLKKFIQVQSFGFGEAEIGLRFADHLEGPWTEARMVFKPVYPGVQKPFMYSVKAHPELEGAGIWITYNVNSFDFNELIENGGIYYPKFLLLKISQASP